MRDAIPCFVSLCYNQTKCVGGISTLWSRSLSVYLAMIDGQEDQNKFEQLYDKYRDLMFYQARQILHDDYAAEDAVSTAFLRIAQNMNKVEQAVSPRTKGLVMRVTKNISIDMYRKRQREQEYHTDFSEVDRLGISYLPEEALADTPLVQAILKLPEANQQVISLKFVYGYDNRKISEITGFTVAKIEKLISRGRKQLKQLLEEASTQ